MEQRRLLEEHEARMQALESGAREISEALEAELQKRGESIAEFEERARALSSVDHRRISTSRPR